ncbi:hypothetical protein [Lactobacillus sp. UCMA15818]|uniref:hypothetical protein n=1 Tax=Lactobacillus sp. UCMA15818 TaxID=2583394 RepID=UPI0025AF4A0D|nr:hypothetical protein [Lactobacillus sp. UCMA15818]MDN2453150.1 hypothetical protein [Lactobacillus sp. UCMA15818]
MTLKNIFYNYVGLVATTFLWFIILVDKDNDMQRFFFIAVIEFPVTISILFIKELVLKYRKNKF